METTGTSELRIKRTFQAPIELMWQVWTDPGHLVEWWGPDGFTSTIHTMDFREGGEWRLTMHSPDGTNFPNRSIFREIVPMKKIVFEHFNPHFITSVTFEAAGGETTIDWRMEFDSAEMRDIVVQAHKAEEGQRQNVERLGHYLRQQQERPVQK